MYIYLCLSLKHCVVSHPPLSWLTYSCFKFHQLLGSLDTSCFTTPKPRNWREFLEKGLRSRLRRTADQRHGESLRIFAMLDCVKSLDFCHELLYFQVFFRDKASLVFWNSEFLLVRLPFRIMHAKPQTIKFSGEDMPATYSSTRWANYWPSI